jgi:branched-chain amino acid transport system permease protein
MISNAETIPMKKVRYGRWLVILPFLAFPSVVSDYYLYYFNMTLVYTILTMGLNLVMGFGGMINLGYAGLFGIGAYACTTSMHYLHLGYFPAIVFGGLVSSLIGFLLAIPAVRLSELGFALVTLAFGEAIVTIIGNLEFLGQYNGLMVPKPSILGFSLAGNFRLYYIAFFFTLVLLVIFVNIMKSNTGRVFIAMADSPVAAKSMGINVNHYRILIFVISSFYAGIAGGLFGPLVTFIDPSSFAMSETILLLMMLIIGGMGSFVGPVLGAGLLSFLPEMIREFKEYQTLVYGIALVTIVIFLPEGIWGSLKGLFNLIVNRKERNRSYDSSN